MLWLEKEGDKKRKVARAAFLYLEGLLIVIFLWVGEEKIVDF